MNAFDLYATPFIPLHSPYKEISRRISAVFLIAVNKAKSGKLVDSSVLIELLLLIGETAHRNIFDIYLNTFARISHLFVRLGLIGWLCWRLRKQSQPFKDSIEALDPAGITTFAKPVPKLG